MKKKQNLISYIGEKFNQVSSKVSFEKKNFAVATNYVITTCAFYHFCFIFLFGFLGLPILSLYNIGSVLIWLVVLYLNLEGKLVLAVSVGGLEIVVHSVLCSLVIGWASGFYLYIFGLVIVLSLLPVKRDSLIVIFIIFCSLTLSIISLPIEFFHPISQVDSTLIVFFRIMNITFFVFVLAIFGFYVSRITERASVALEKERSLSERLLHNILPPVVAERLKSSPEKIADGFSATTILFSDIVGFTPYSKTVPPNELVSILNDIFSIFDKLTDKHGLEKIKTIGDAYMVAGGIPTPREDHAEAIANMAIEMNEELEKFNQYNGHNFQIRTGIHSGEAVAGVIGIKKFIYDLWGDTVNTASRMESHGLPGEIQVSEQTFELLKGSFSFEERGEIEVKGKGMMKTYLLKDRI